MTRPVAVLDLGSNTIKLLVAAASPDGRLVTLHYAVEEARISQGIAAARPRLSDEGRRRGVDAVCRLAAQARSFLPATIVAVATSAVRDAENGGEFCREVLAAAGVPVRILSGTEEANLIGRGLAADPALEGARDFYLFDLGGGSLECLRFRQRRIEHATSLQLGCVRLTERLIADPARPFTAADRSAVDAAVCAAFAADGFQFSLPAPVTAVATGGTVTTARAMLAGGELPGPDAASAIVDVDAFEGLWMRVAALPLAGRRQVPGLPPSRADVFPAAAATLLTVARLASARRFTHSFYNLRYGLAAELLGL